MVRRETALTWMLILISAALFSVASAQDVVGTIEGTVDGEAEPRVWYSLHWQNDEGEDRYSSEWDTIVSGVEIVIEGNPEPELGIEGKLELRFLTLDGIPEACPCTYDDVSVIYRASVNPYSDLFTTDKGVITFTSFEPVGEDVFRAAGTFEATLEFVEVFRGESDPSRTMSIVGSFVIERLPKD